MNRSLGAGRTARIVVRSAVPVLCLLVAACHDSPRRTSKPDSSSEAKTSAKPPPPPPAADLPRLPPADPAKLAEIKPGFLKQTAQLPNGSTLHYCVSVPQSYDGKTPVPLAVVLHPSSKKIFPHMSKDVIEDLFGNAFEELTAIVIAPDSLGGDWTTPENEQAVVWLTRSALMSYAVDPDRVILAGFSTGGNGVWSIGSRWQQLYTAAVPVAGKPKSGNDWKIPVFAVHSKMDNKVPIGAVQFEVNKLRGAGVPAEIKELTGLYNEQMPRYTAGTGESVAWLKEQWKSRPKKPATQDAKPTSQNQKPAKPAAGEKS